MIVQVTDSTFVRDTTSTALINKDENGLQDYLKRRNIMAAQKQDLNNVKLEISDMKDDIQEIKQLLTQLLGKGSNG